MLPDYGLITKADKLKLDSIPSDTLLTEAVASETYITKSAAADTYITSDTAVRYINRALGGGGSAQPDKFVNITTSNTSATAPHNAQDNVYLYTTLTGSQTISNSGSNCTIYTGVWGKKTIYDTGDYNTYIYDDIYTGAASLASAHSASIFGATENDTVVIHGHPNPFTALANAGTFQAGFYNYLKLQGKRNPAYSDTATFAVAQFDSIPAGTHFTYQRCYGTTEDVLVYGYINTGTNTQDYYRVDNQNITNSGDHCTLYASSYPSTIRSTGNHCSIVPYSGNDYIYDDGEYNIYYRIPTYGADTICGYTANDTLYIPNYNVLSFAPTYEGYKCTINSNASYTVTIKGRRRTGNTNYNVEAYQHLTPGTKIKISKDGTTYDAFVVPYFAAAVNPDAETYNNESNCWFFGTNGDDSLYNTGDNVTINASIGANYIDNNGSNVSIFAGAGDDTINNNWSNNVTINAGTGNNSIHTGSGEKCSVYASGYNTIVVDGSYQTISTANLASSISVGGGEKHSIITGSGNDTLIFGGSESRASLGDGVNVCTITGDRNTLHGGSTNDSIVVGEPQSWSGEYSWINLGAGNNFLTVQGGSQHTIACSSGNDYVTLAALGGSSVNLGSGNNDIEIYDCDDTIICAGGADSIKLLDGSYGCSVSTGASTDYITIKSGYHTIHSGANNDVIFSESNAGQYFVFGTGEGNNTICGFDFTYDYLYIRDNSAVATVSNNANGLRLTVGNTNITIKGAGSGSALSGYASVESGQGVYIQYANGDSGYLQVP